MTKFAENDLRERLEEYERKVKIGAERAIRYMDMESSCFQKIDKFNYSKANKMKEQMVNKMNELV